MPKPSFDVNSEIANSVSQLIGNTPMLHLNKLAKTKGNIYVKLETENPMASVKDRLAYGIYEKGERDGKMIPGRTVIVEATSGNTGIALAHQGAVRGYKVIIVMPESMSMERRCLVRIFGAELILTPAALGMKGAVAKAIEIVATNPDAVAADQFSTKYNAEIHQETTGPEIWRQMKGKVDCFIAGVGTGGTLVGVARYLKSVGSNARIIAVEPAESAVLSGGKPGVHLIQGIGPGFTPECFDRSCVDEVIAVTSDEATATSLALSRAEGLFCGFSSGANVFAALRVAMRPEFEGKNVVTLIPSFGERYLTSSLYQSIKDEVSNYSVSPATEFS